MNPEKLKELVAEYIISLLPDSGIIALGSGSTVNHVIDEISSLPNSYKFVSASSGTSIRLQKYGLQEVQWGYAMDQSIQLCIDGADIIFPSDPGLIIKGHGGALLQEKLMWSISNKIYVVVDESKKSDIINKDIPIEISPRSLPVLHNRIININEISDLQLRSDSSTGMPFITDNNNYIIHATVTQECDLRKLHKKLKKMTGVVETGIFTDELTSNATIVVSAQSGVYHLN